MRFLLDTHILLWRMARSDRLSKAAINLIDEEGHDLFASAASVWEVSIKWALRKGTVNDMPLSGEQFLRALEDVGIDVLPINPMHAVGTEELPMHHRDPFDRLLVATARHEGMVLLTHDRQLAGYGNAVQVIAD